MTNITVSLVTWDQCNQVQLAVYLNKDTGRVQPAFTDKISLAAEYGIIVHLLGVNDTGDYCCKFHTFPDGLYEGRVSLEMTGESMKALIIQIYGGWV